MPRTILVRLIFLFVLPGSAGNTVYGQAIKGQVEVSAGVGMISFYRIVDKVISLNGDNYRSSGAYNFSYRYYVTRRFSFGVNLAYEYVNSHRDVTVYGVRGNSDQQRFLTMSPEVTFTYVDRRRHRSGLRLYWLAAWGITSVSDKFPGENPDRAFVPLGIQITPVGVRVGHDLAGYAELGFGYKGLLSAGLSYRFPKKAAPQTVFH
jgi:hypothetical protein